MKQIIGNLFSSDKILIALSMCIYVLGCVIESHI